VATDDDMVEPERGGGNEAAGCEDVFESVKRSEGYNSQTGTEYVVPSEVGVVGMGARLHARESLTAGAKYAR
jgi:hypothetical protein